MKSHSFLLILAFINLGRCGGDKPSDSLSVSQARVLTATVADTVRLGIPIHVEITCGTPNPCWEFKNFEISRHEKEFSIKVFAQYDGRPCIQVLGSFTADTSLLVQQRGTYIFRFDQNGVAAFEKTVVVQ